jgi:hypothetical protein
LEKTSARGSCGLEDNLKKIEKTLAEPADIRYNDFVPPRDCIGDWATPMWPAAGLFPLQTPTV